MISLLPDKNPPRPNTEIIEILPRFIVDLLSWSLLRLTHALACELIFIQPILILFQVEKAFRK